MPPNLRLKLAHVMRNLPWAATVLLCACSRGSDATLPSYRIDSVDSLERARGIRVHQVWVTLPTYASEGEIAALAGRLEDSVAKVHPDLWSIQLLFYTSQTGRETRVAEFTWGPDGEKDLFGRLHSPRRWSSRYNPASRDSILRSLAEYGNSFGDQRSGIITRLGSPATLRTIDPKQPAYRYHPAASLSGADSFLVLDYPTASFEVTASNADTPEMLWTIRAWGPLAGLSSALVPGQTTRSEVIAVLGQPDYPVVSAPSASDSTVLTYEFFGRSPELIGFYIVRDTLRMIRWQFRVG